MYPTRIGFQSVIERINQLRTNGHSAEALVTSIFTLEKLIRRSLRVALISRGFTSSQVERLLKRKGFKDLNEMWDIYDRKFEKLSTILGQPLWTHMNRAVEMRNQMVHGNRVFDLNVCENYTVHVVEALEQLHKEITRRFERDPWQKMKIRKVPQLSWLAA
jgi:hypothetical protein